MIESCPLCKNPGITALTTTLRDGKGTIYKCHLCQHVFLSPEVGEVGIEKFYNAFYARDAQRTKELSDQQIYLKKISIDSFRRMETCREYIDLNHSCLETGAGYGLFSYSIRPLVARMVLVDPSETTAANCRKYNLEYSRDISCTSGQFDRIFAFHTLEHFIDPATELRTLYQRLNSGGLLFIEVPNVHDLIVRLSRRYRDFYFQLAHLHYFSAVPLKALFSNAGFTVVKKVPVQRYGFSNHLKWICGIQLKLPALIETLYQFLLARTPFSDTLFYVLKK